MAATKDELESRLHEELGNADSDRRAIEALVKETEQKYAETIHGLQDEIGEKDLLLQARDDEMRAFKMEVRAAHSRLNEVTAAKERAEMALQQELHQEQQRRQESEIAHKDSARSLCERARSSARRINEREQTLKSRDGEIKLLAAQIATLNEQLHKAEIAKDRTAVSLQEQIRKEQEIRHANDSAIRGLEDSFRAKISALEKQLARSKKRRVTPDNVELEGLRAELDSANQRMSEMARRKKMSRACSAKLCREKTELLRSKEIARKDLEEDFADKLRIS